MIKNLLELLFHKNELNRLRNENEHLIEYNKKLNNLVRLKNIEVRQLTRKLNRLEK